MQNFCFEQTIVIRPIRFDTSEINATAAMQCATYRRQFYDPQGTLGGELGKAYPMLERYETEEVFKGTWQKLAKMVAEPTPRGYAYVAFLVDRDQAEPVAIAKSMAWQAGDDLAENLTVYGKAKKVQDVAELGSVYVRQDFQDKGLGALMVARVARDALTKGYSQMVTRAYAKNVSPRFFVEKAFGQIMGSCAIPYGYDPAILDAKGLRDDEMPSSIPGTWIFWNTRAIQKVAGLIADDPVRKWSPLNGRASMRCLMVTQQDLIP
ncbi:MAG: GNAT family N-acetyltransferase [Alphaproteobacteria bacterium]|nr:GNAT family N-acetyltransferase [Alphaproteobacteria bacterium]